MLKKVVVSWCVLLAISARSVAEDPTTVAGRSIQDYAVQLDDADRVIRLRAVKSLGAFGAAAAEPLQRALDHSDAAVRYTAAVHLGRIGGPSLESAEQRLQQLADDESSLAVRMAASFALCRAGSLEKHLPLLVETLNFPERGMACSAAELIGQIGPPAAAAIEPLQRVYQKHRPGAQGGDYHIGGAAQNALRKLNLQSSM
jgi:HEAT repeat protein